MGDGEVRKGSNVVIGLLMGLLEGQAWQGVLFLLLTFLNDLLDGLHLSLYEPIGLWEPG